MRPTGPKLPTEPATGAKPSSALSQGAAQARKVMQKASGPLIPELREGDSLTINRGNFYADVSDAPIPVIRHLIREALANPNYNRGFVIAHLDQAWKARVFKDTGVQLNNSALVLRAQEIRHSWNRHTNPAIERSRGQVVLKSGQWTQAIRIIRDYDYAEAGDSPGTVRFFKTIGNERVIVVAEEGKRNLIIKTTYTKARL